MKYKDNMTDEELKQFISEIDALHEAYTDAFKEPAWTEEIDEETGDILLYKAALNRGQP